MSVRKIRAATPGFSLAKPGPGLLFRTFHSRWVSRTLSGHNTRHKSTEFRCLTRPAGSEIRSPKTP